MYDTSNDMNNCYPFSEKFQRFALRRLPKCLTNLPESLSSTGCFFTGPGLKVLSMELIPLNKEPSLHSEYIQHHGYGQSQPPGSSFLARTLFEHWSTHKQACLEVRQLIKIMPKLLSRKECSESCLNLKVFSVYFY